MIEFISWLEIFSIGQVLCLFAYYCIIKYKYKTKEKLIRNNITNCVYTFKIMEIRTYPNSYHNSFVLLCGMDGIKVRLSVKDYNRHKPKINQFFCMDNAGKICILTKE